MNRRLCVIASLLFGLFIIPLAYAQGAPAQIDIALNDLSNRVGRTLAITDLSNWRWGQQNYPNSALGCEGVQGTGTDVAGYQFTLTYGGINYDYRVSADNTIVVLCNQLNSNQPTAVPPLDEQYSNQLCVESEGDLPYMRTRINVGLDIEVTTGVLNLRAQPSSNAEVLLQIPTGQSFRVDGGPSCVDNFVWWYVNYNGQLGYIAEGNNGEYFVEPQRPEPLQSREIMTPFNLVNLREFATITGNFVPHLAWSPDSLRLVLPGARGSDSIWVYRTDALTLLPEIIESDESMSTIEFHPNGTRTMFGTEQGTVHLWQVIADSNNTIFETLFLNTHQQNITSIAFSPDGARFVSSGQGALTTVNLDTTWAAIIWDIQTVEQRAILSGHQGLIRDMVWSPDGTKIITAGDDGTVRVWDASTGTSLSVIQVGTPVTSLAYSSNGQFIAVGLAQSDGRVLLLDGTSYVLVSEYQVTSAGISSLAFSPDNTMLLVGGADNIFAVWNTQNDQPITTLSVADTIRHVSFSPDGSFITVATNKPSVSFYGVPFVSG
jgi:WD40 repeat protein